MLCEESRLAGVLSIEREGDSGAGRCVLALLVYLLSISDRFSHLQPTFSPPPAYPQPTNSLISSHLLTLSPPSASPPPAQPTLSLTFPTIPHLSHPCMNPPREKSCIELRICDNGVTNRMQTIISIVYFRAARTKLHMHSIIWEPGDRFLSGLSHGGGVACGHHADITPMDLLNHDGSIDDPRIDVDLYGRAWRSGFREVIYFSQTLLVCSCGRIPGEDYIYPFHLDSNYQWPVKVGGQPIRYRTGMWRKLTIDRVDRCQGCAGQLKDWTVRPEVGDQSFSRWREVQDLIKPVVPDQESDGAGYIYLIGCNDEWVKIGKSINPDERIKNIQAGNPYRLELIHKIHCRKMNHCERLLHWHFRKCRGTGEWFKLSHQDLTAVSRCLDQEELMETLNASDKRFVGMFGGEKHQRHPVFVSN